MSPASRPDPHAQLVAHLDALEAWATWTRGALPPTTDPPAHRPQRPGAPTDPLDAAGVPADDELSVAHALLNLAGALGDALETLGATIDAHPRGGSERAGLVVSIVGDAISDAAGAADDYVVELATR